MTSDHDIYRSAQALIKRYGDDAPAESEKRAKDLFARDDVEGAAEWAEIATATRALLAKKQPKGGKAH